MSPELAGLATRTVSVRMSLAIVTRSLQNRIMTTHDLDVLDEAECYVFLHSRTLGRIGVKMAKELSIFPVYYAVMDHDIVFRTAPGTKLDAAVLATRMVFEVDNASPGWSVVVRGHAHELARRGLPHGLFECAEQRGIRRLIVERATRLIERRDAAFGNQEAHRAGHRVELVGEERADRTAFVGGRAHQRHGRVVAVEVPRAQALGHRVPGAEVHHVERAARADVRQRAAREDVEPRRPGREHAAADLVGDAVLQLVGNTSPYLALLTICVASVILGQFISNVATVLVIAPIAVSVASSMGVSVQPFMMALTVVGAAAFLTPIATPVNLMVMQPAGYRFGDYWRLGLPLVAIYVAVAVLYVPLIWPF